VKSEVSTLRARDIHMVFDRGKQMENPRSLVYKKPRDTRTVQGMKFDINGNCLGMPPPNNNCSRSQFDCFEGACLGSGAEKPVCRFAQAKLYAI
jgi:hypothetical protein